MTYTEATSRFLQSASAITELRGGYYIAWKLWGKLAMLMTGDESKALRTNSDVW